MNRVVLFSAIAYTLFGLATLCTVGRGLSRWRKSMSSGFGSDDWISLLTYACVVGLTVANYYQLFNGLGQDAYTLDAKMVERFLLWTYISHHFYVAITFGTKLSVVLLYLRVWRKKSTFRIACMFLALSLVCAFVAFEVVTIIQCLPIAQDWTTFPGATTTCINRTAFAYSLASVDIAFNVIVLLFAVPRLLRPDTSLRRKDTSLQRKACVCAAFFVGLAVIAISAVRLVYLNGLTTELNVSRYYSYLGLYSSIEAYLSQICCCVPPFVAIFNRERDISSRLSGGSRKSASTARSQNRESGGVVGIKGIGPSEPEDPEKARSEDGGSYEDYERAPSPTIGFSSHRALDETISSRSQFPIQQQSPVYSRRVLQTFLDDSDTSTETSVEDLQSFDEESESSFEALPATHKVGVPSIVQNDYRRSQQLPQAYRLSQDLTIFSQEVKRSERRSNIHSW